jgi:hypothetical protein
VSGRAEAAEVALQQAAADYEARLTKLQASYSKQVAVVAELRKGRAPRDGQVGFTNTNKCVLCGRGGGAALLRWCGQVVVAGLAGCARG